MKLWHYGTAALRGLLPLSTLIEWCVGHLKSENCGSVGFWPGSVAMINVPDASMDAEYGSCRPKPHDGKLLTIVTQMLRMGSAVDPISLRAERERNEAAPVV